MNFNSFLYPRSGCDRACARLYRRYEALADALSDVSFVDRLATYRYYDMDQMVEQALATYRRLVPRLVQASAAA